LIVYAAEVLIDHAVELAARETELTVFVDRVDREGLIPRVFLARAVLRAPELLQLPTAVAIEVELALLRAFVAANAVSLWTLHSGGELKHVAHGGDFTPTADPMRQLARRLLGDERAKPPRVRNVSGLAIERGHRPGAALVVRGSGVAAATRTPILGYAAPMLTAMLERDELLARAHDSEEAIVASAERRLSRLRFDLHDGPQQDVVLLAEDVRLLRALLEGMLRGRDKTRVLGRLDDLEGQLVAIDGNLRRISGFVQSPFLHAEGLPEALAKLTDEFTARTGIEPNTTVEGDFAELTDSQQITLLGLIREALSNVREHSAAEHVMISVIAGPDGVEATVSDDGQGFDPETTLVEAARGGHLGLVGMHERVHMLGGRTQIDSRPGGPTVISVRLPRFVREWVEEVPA
jgi:signal transduction histidine kinase